MRLRVMTAGESHGSAMVAIVEGLPFGLEVSADRLDRELARRQSGYGRGGRMKIESDSVKFISGVRHGRTIGSPVALLIENRDSANWRETMAVEGGESEPATRPRPGHADLAGMLKYGTRDARDILERASARETAARVAAGALARTMLERLGIVIRSRVTGIGTVRMELSKALHEGFAGVDESPVYCPDNDASRAMVEEIDQASQAGDSLGGVFEVCAFGMVPGLGSHAQYDRRLDAELFAALASIPAVKGVESGSGFELASMKGTEAQDGIGLDNGTLARNGNRAGGIEGGISNGEPLLLKAAMKPIPSTATPQNTVDISDLSPAESFKERADICAVPAASVIGEALVAIVLADAVLDKFGGDSMVELERNFKGYLDDLNPLWRRT